MDSSNKPTSFDYIIVGGGTAGCVVAARLREALSHLSIALIEAGPDATSNQLVENPRAALALHDTDLQWEYISNPQKYLNVRTLPNWGGKLLSGSSAVNYSGWTRGHAADYDRWADVVGDERWSFKSLLPAFKRSEHSYNPEPSTASLHGFEGPIRLQSGDFGFPLREPVKQAFQSTGFEFNPDLNSGDPNGVCPVVLNWFQLKRQHAAACYLLDGVHILCESVVSKVLFDSNKTAIGVQLADSQQTLHDRKEVIISCGGIRTPQLLMLSGIGPQDQLERHHIPELMHLPDVGQNLRDHHGVTMYFKLKTPEKGFAFGSTAFNKPSFANTIPMDWMITGKAQDSDLERAAQIDNTVFKAGQRSDYELTPMWMTNRSVPNPWLPMDGSYISCGSVCLSSTASGTVTLRSTDPSDNPVHDPQAMSTEHDRAVVRAGMRAVIAAMSSLPLAPFLEKGTMPPPGLPSLTTSSTDEELDEYIKELASPYYHSAGTAAIGHVVDSECRVKGTQGLRVVDASIIPHMISAHMQAPVYAIAEQAASMIVESAT